jgi:hypothetical protein
VASGKREAPLLGTASNRRWALLWEGLRPWVSDRRRCNIAVMETTRRSGASGATSATALRLLMGSIACVSFGMVLIGLSFVATAIERTGLNWKTVALLVLLTFCGLGLTGIMMQTLSGGRADLERGLSGHHGH